MVKLALVKLAHRTFCRGVGILAWLAFCYTMRQAQLFSFSYFTNLRQLRKSKVEKERTSKVLDAIYLTIPLDPAHFETTQIISQRMGRVRNGSASWPEIVRMFCQSSTETTLSTSFYKLIRELTEQQINPSHIIVIYTLFVDVMTVFDSADIASEVKNLQSYLLEFYGTLNPL